MIRLFAAAARRIAPLLAAGLLAPAAAGLAAPPPDGPSVPAAAPGAAALLGPLLLPLSPGPLPVAPPPVAIDRPTGTPAAGGGVASPVTPAATARGATEQRPGPAVALPPADPAGPLPVAPPPVAIDRPTSTPAAGGGVASPVAPAAMAREATEQRPGPAVALPPADPAGRLPVAPSPVVIDDPTSTPAAGGGVASPVTPAATAPQAAASPSPAAATSQPELVLDRRHRQLRVLLEGRLVRTYPVAVGRPGWETPVGRFTVLDKQINPVWEHPVSGQRIAPGPDNPLGSRWIGFHRDCLGRRGFNGSQELVVHGCVVAGFHGTPNRASVGQAVSHGCVRLYEEHVRELFDLVRVGTPITVLP